MLIDEGQLLQIRMRPEPEPPRQKDTFARKRGSEARSASPRGLRLSITAMATARRASAPLRRLPLLL